MESVRIEVRQFRALTDSMDAEGFVLIRPEELTDVELAQTADQLRGLCGSIVDELTRRGVVDTTGWGDSHKYHAAGR